MARNKRKNRIANTLAVCFWLCAWQAASVCIGQKLILVSPLEVCGALLALLPTADFWQTAAFSAGRIIGGFLLALALGLALAALAAALRWVEVLLRPLMLTIKSIPVASFIILALMWLRSAGNLAVFISFLMVLPVVYTNTLAGIRETDARLLEMAAVKAGAVSLRARRAAVFPLGLHGGPWPLLEKRRGGGGHRHHQRQHRGSAVQCKDIVFHGRAFGMDRGDRAAEPCV